jgi:hypothetical protein
MTAFRKHAGWYTKGFASSARLRERLMRATSLDELERALADIDRDLPYPADAHLFRRGKRGGTQKVVLPEGFLDDPEDASPPPDAGREAVSGG